MLGRTPGNIVAVRPLRQGVISDYKSDRTDDEALYSEGASLAGKRSESRLSLYCVPSGVTEKVEKKAVEDATYQAGARDVKIIIENRDCRSDRVGIDISKPCGNMIVLISAAALRILRCTLLAARSSVHPSRLQATTLTRRSSDI